MAQLDHQIQERVNKWLGEDYDEETRSTLQQLIDSNKTEDIIDAFYRDLEFGTGGLRGIMGVGTNRVNKYTIGAATQGLSNYLKQQYPEGNIKVVISYDNRNNATVFAKIVADVFSANGIYTYFFKELRPTPELSFAIRHLGCQSGVMLTASHNPREYSGYKAYWNDGGQIIAPHDKNIIAEVNKISSVDQINFRGNPALIEMIGDEIDAIYLEKVKAVSLNPNAIQAQHDLKIVFSPIHGAGVKLVPDALKAVGFSNVNLVKEQCVIDGNFPTVVYPNPEEEEAMTLSLKLAGEIDADLVLATDPDADRVGIAVKNDKGEFILLNGNQTGTLLFHYLLTQWEEKGKLTGIEYIVKTIVTTYLLDKIAASKKVMCYNTLTGFKFIGDLMTKLEGKQQFIAGCEESYGYLVGDHARDKDSVVACTMIAEMAAYYKNKGITLYESLQDIHVEYGFYKEALISITKKGKSGAEEIAAIMHSYREQPPAMLGGHRVLKVNDYQSSLETDIETGNQYPIDLPKSNVLQFFTEGDIIVSARPSGTEPKIKFYISVNTRLKRRSDYAEKEQKLDEMIAAIKEDLS